MQAPFYRVRHLHKTYRRGQIVALEDLSFDIEQGEIFGLLGPNGAGKTTLVRLLVGLLAPSSGTIHLLGEDMGRAAHRVPHLVSYFAQRPGALSSVPAHLAVALTGHMRGLTRHEADRQASALLGEFHLDRKASRPVGKLSGGEQRLVALAAALIGDLPALVLDEPTNELDPEHRRRVWDLLLERNRRMGTTIILVTHNVLEAERVIRRVGILHRGRILALGTTGELKARVDRRVRVEVKVGERATQEGLQAWQQRLALPEHPWMELGRGHYAVLLPAEQVQGVIARMLAEPGLREIDDFRILTPTLEDVYLQLGGGASLAEPPSPA